MYVLLTVGADDPEYAVDVSRPPGPYVLVVAMPLASVEVSALPAGSKVQVVVIPLGADAVAGWVVETVSPIES